jgi:hypothetical protein
LQSRLKRFDVNGKDLVFAKLPVHESPAALGSRLVGVPITQKRLDESGQFTG